MDTRASESWRRDDGLGALAGRRVLITGATGLIGSALAARLRDQPCRLRLFARHQPEAVDGRADVEILLGDVRDQARWEQALDGVDVLIHLAAQTSALIADRDPRADWDVNVGPLLHALETFRRRAQRPTIVVAGSETQAGIPARLPLDETMPDNPVTVYDAHKLMAEQYLELYARRGLVRGVCLRLPTVYGPGPPARPRERGLIAGAVRRALAQQPLTIHGSGSFLRDFLHVDDVTAALMAAVTHVDALDGRHLLLGTGAGRTVADALQLVADATREQTGREVVVERIEPPAGWGPLDERNVIVDPTSFSRLTGWKAQIQLEDGIASMVAALAGREPAAMAEP